MQIVNLINNYLKKVEDYPDWRFVFELTMVAFILKILFIIIFGLIFILLGLPVDPDLSFEEGMAKNNFFIIVILTTLFASFETLTSQWFIIWLASKFIGSIYWKIIISAIIFSLLHTEPLLVITVFPIGILLAWSFIIKRKKSRWKAFWVTTAIHILHNLIATSSLFLVKS